jgi:hypothetical protein
MTQTELATALETLGLSVAYGEFVNTEENPAPAPPFLCYQFYDNDDLMADNKNAVGLDNYQVELYTDYKDPVTEKLVEDLLEELCIPYHKFEAKLEDEDMYQIVYEIQLTD